MKNTSAVLKVFCATLVLCPTFKAMDLDRTQIVLDRRGGQIRVLTEEGFEKAKRLQLFYDEQQKEKSVRFHQPPKEVSDEDLELARALSLSFVEPSESSKERALRLEEGDVEEAIRLSLSEISAQPIPLDDGLLREKNASPFRELPKFTGDESLGFSPSSRGSTPSQEVDRGEGLATVEENRLPVQASPKPRSIDDIFLDFALSRSAREHEDEEKEVLEAIRQAEEREQAEKKQKAHERRHKAYGFLSKERESRSLQRDLLFTERNELGSKIDKLREELSTLENIEPELESPKLGDMQLRVERREWLEKEIDKLQNESKGFYTKIMASFSLNDLIHDETKYLLDGGEPRYQDWMDGLSESFRSDYKRFLEDGGQLPISPVPERVSSPFLPLIPSSALPNPDSLFSPKKEDFGTK